MQCLVRVSLYSRLQDWALGLLHTKCVCGALWLGNSPLKQNLDRVRNVVCGTVHKLNHDDTVRAVLSLSLQMYRNGIRNMNLMFIILKIVLPITLYLSLTLIIPYVFSQGLVPQLMYIGEGATTYSYQYLNRLCTAEYFISTLRPQGRSLTLLLLPLPSAHAGLPFSAVNYIQRRIYPYTTLLLLLSLVSLAVLSQCQRLYQKIRDDRYTMQCMCVPSACGALEC